MNKSLFACGMLFMTCGSAFAVNSVQVASPDGNIRAEVTLDTTGKAAVPQVRITYKDRPILMNSPLQVELADGIVLGMNAVIEDSKTLTIHNEYRQYPGKRSKGIDHCTEAVITLRQNEPSPRRWQLVVRAYDDGAAFRYRFAKQEGWTSLVIASERTSFVFPEDATAVALPLNSFTGPYEKLYERKPVKDLPGDWLLGLPLLVELPGTAWAAITEANLTDYAGVYLARQPQTGSALISRLSPLPKEPKVAVRATLPHDSPWRVVMIAERPEKLIESDIVLNLNEPCAIKDTSWIQSGKTTFPWWNGFFEQNVPFKLGMNTATAKYYIDFCAEAGFPYHSLDGTDSMAWYGGPIAYIGANPITPTEGLDIDEVLKYAKAKGVRLRLWMHWLAARDYMTRSFPIYHKWGVEGVMIDFMDRDDQEMVVFLRKLIELAAENQLTVTLHGMSKPTGLERTYPNLLSHEAVRSLEYDKWDQVGIPPEHDVTIPFTRMLAGPLDYHQGSFRTVPVAEYKPQNIAPRIMGTPCHTLATYVVYQNHLSMAADYPSAYRGHPGLPVLVRIPTSWDDTRAVAGEVGEYVVVARRSGNDWWVGAMTSREARELKVPLAFLGDGSYRAEIHRDDPAATHGMTSESRDVKASDVIEAKLGESGGLVIHLTPVTAKP